MTSIVHSFADEELEVFASTGRRSFAVRLSFSTDAIDTVVAQASFERFLDHACKLEEAGEAGVEVFAYRDTNLTRIDPSKLKLWFEPAASIDFLGQFKSWFKSRAAALSKPDQFSSLTTAGDAERSEDELSAQDILAGVSTWPAPAPHILGLAFRVDVDELDLADAIVVVPTLGGATTGVAIGGSLQVGTADKEQIDVDYGVTAPPRANYEFCRAGVSSLPDISDGKTLVDAGTGFVASAFADDELGRAMRRIEQRGGSLFTGYLAATGIAWPETLFEKPASPDDEPIAAPYSDQVKLWLVCLAWRAASTLEASLDTLLLALLMPGREKFRDGLVLGPLLDLLIRKGFPTTATSASQKRRELRAAVRQGLLDFVRRSRSDDSSGLQLVMRLCDLKQNGHFAHKLLLFGSWSSGATIEQLVEAAEEIGKAAKRPVSFDLLRSQLDVELTKLNESVLAEKGAERSMIELLRTADVVASIASGDLDKASEYNVAVDEFAALLDAGLNGAEAARQSVGMLIADLAASKSAKTGDHSADNLKRVIESWDFWTTRLERGLFSPDPVDDPQAERPAPILVRVVRPFADVWRSAGLSADYDRELGSAEGKISAAAVGMTLRCLDELFPSERVRFVPDHAPQPLLVPIAVDPFIDDETSPDSFSVSFAGLGVLVRQGQQNWAYACLSEFIDPSPPVNAGISSIFNGMPLTIAPLPTAVVDGRRELFISYTGRPFSSAAYVDSIAAGDRDPSGDPFFTLDHPGALRLAEYDDLPALAYGRRYHFAAHVVGRSGSLPDILQRPKSPPWRPRVTVPESEIGSVLMSLPMSRRTSIGRVVIADDPTATQKRIGLRPDGLRPLSADYRRIAIAPGAAVDILRNADGSGVIDLPALGYPPKRVVLRDLQCWGSHGERMELAIVVSTRTDATLDPADTSGMASTSIKIGAGHVGDVTVAFDRKTINEAAIVVTWRADDTEKTVTVTLALQSRESCWMSLAVVSGMSVSLADPTLEWDGPPGTGRGEPDNLLLLGAPFTDASGKPRALWRQPFDAAAEVDIVLPRMTLGDFLRWTDNDELRNAALGIPREETEHDRIKEFDRFRALLVALDIDRLGNGRAAERLDLLPDLAVVSVALTAAPADSLTRSPSEMATGDSRARATQAEIEMPNLWALISDKGVREKIDQKRIVSALDLIDTKLRHRLTVATSEPDPKGVSNGAGAIEFIRKAGSFNLTVGGGLVARLSARPVVAKEFFIPTLHPHDAPVIDRRMLQFAVGETKVGYVFDGAHITVETMIGPLVHVGAKRPWLASRADWARERGEAVLHLPAGSSRIYQLALSTAPELHWRWRQVGAVTTWTQAWRFCGRPVRTWIKPLDHVADATAAPRDQASLHLQKIDQSFLSFEDDAFNPRDDLDAMPETVTLDPLGRNTTLATVEADEKKGATMFRHAFTLSSRYASAMRRSETDGAAEAWQLALDGQPNAADRWMRVAVLGTRQNEMTRPQLRALMPLTRRTGQDGPPSFAPPVLAVLNEVPFANGGLAARIASEIRTGVGYGGDPIRPLDFRKEVGPDGRLHLVPMSSAYARRAVLANEGPIGLTFDSDATTAPAFANTALMLHPSILPDTAVGKFSKGSAGSLDDLSSEGISEESFISVALRRYLDPHWLVPDASESQDFTLQDGALWIAAHDDITLRLTSSQDSTNAFDGVSATADRVEIDGILIDSSVHSGSMLQLCGRPTAELGLLIVPYGGRRFTLGVFCAPSATEGVSGNLPIMLASADCQIPDDFMLEFQYDRDSTAIRRTTASALTSLEWVRTNQDFDFVTIADTAFSGKRAKVEDLVAQKSSKPQRLTFLYGANEGWVRAQHSTRTDATHCQRHMVCLFIKTLTGLGPDIESPIGAALMPGRAMPISGRFAQADAVRIVEIETPAHPAAFPRDAVRPEFAWAYFDLLSIGAATAINDSRRFLFRILHVGDMAGFPGAGTGSVSFDLVVGTEKPIDVAAANLPDDTCELLLVVDIVKAAVDPAKAEAGKAEVAWRIFVVTSAGAVSEHGAASRAVRASLQPIERLGISIRELKTGKPADNAVTFVEISMLTSLRPLNFDVTLGFDFDFDWLFGVVPQHDAKPDDPAALADWHEAQARCVSVSQRIPLETVP